MASIEQRRPDIAAGTLVVGAIAHALLCGPAIGCRGYPPLPSILYGITFLWPVAVVISAYFDSMHFGERRSQLIVYSLATAFFTAGTVVFVIPRHVSLRLMVFGAIFYSPVHLLVTFIVEAVVQWVYSMGRQLADKETHDRALSFSLFTLLAVFSWIGLLLGIPFGFRSAVNAALKRSAIAQANKDWATSALTVRRSTYEQYGDCWVGYEFDPKTGLKLKRRMSDRGFGDHYNARIDELISLHGLPSCSVKSAMPKPGKLVEMLGSTDMTSVDEFPCDLSKTIRLTRRKGISDSDYDSDYGSLVIKTPHSNLGIGNGNNAVHVSVADENIYIRNGPNWIGVFLPDGRMLMSASR